MVKISVNRFVSRRIETIRNEIRAETQRLRHRTLDQLEEIFKISAKVIGGEIKHQRINGKMASISLNQRRRWLRLAEHVALMMKGIASNFDEQQILAQLNELEKLINEANITD